MESKLEAIKRTTKFLEELITEREHEQTVKGILDSLKSQDAISPATWIMLGIDHGQHLLLQKLTKKGYLTSECLKKLKGD